MAALPAPARNWLDARSFPVVATVDPDGRPQLSVVWAKHDGDDVVFSTLSNRRKGRNLARDSSISILIPNPNGPNEYVELRGTATVTPDPGGSLIKELGRHYDGEEFWEPEEQAARRVIVRIAADHVVTYGVD